MLLVKIMLIWVSNDIHFILTMIYHTRSTTAWWTCTVPMLMWELVAMARCNRNHRGLKLKTEERQHRTRGMNSPTERPYHPMKQRPDQNPLGLLIIPPRVGKMCISPQSPQKAFQIGSFVGSLALIRVGTQWTHSTTPPSSDSNLGLSLMSIFFLQQWIAQVEMRLRQFLSSTREDNSG